MKKPIRVNRTAKKKITVQKSETGKKPIVRKRPSRTTEGTGKSAPITGAAGFARGRQEKKRGDENARRRQLPWDFYIDVKKGETQKDMILLDNEPVFIYEHSLQDSAGKWTTERCIRDTGHCPLCTKLGKEGTYVLKLTCIDLTPYEKRDGTKMKATKRIVTVKTQQLSKFERMFEKYGTFRGLKVRCYRETDKEARIGSDFEVMAKLSEEKLAKYGKDLNSPLDFPKLFPLISEKELANRWGASRALGAKSLDEDDDDDADDSGWD